jgi:hypothetical protein
MDSRLRGNDGWVKRLNIKSFLEQDFLDLTRAAFDRGLLYNVEFVNTIAVDF